jgi:hypothetical protein
MKKKFDDLKLSDIISRVTRVEVIDELGRSYVNWDSKNKTDIQFQDDWKTLKIFISKEK